MGFIFNRESKLLAVLLAVLAVGCAPRMIVLQNQSQLGAATLETQYGGTSSLMAKIFLQGPFNTGTHVMSTSLNSLGRLPTSSPYGADEAFGVTGTIPSVAAGFFAANPNIVDWIQVELRVTQSSEDTLIKKSVFIDKFGNICDLDGATQISTGLTPGSYYAVIRHKSHLAVVTSYRLATSASPVLEDLTDSVNDFSSGCTVSAGVTDMAATDCVRNMGSTGIYGMVVGDYNQDGWVTFSSAGSVVGDADYFLNTVLGGVAATVINAYGSCDGNMNGAIRYNGISNDKDVLLTQSLKGDGTASIQKDPNI